MIYSLGKLSNNFITKFSKYVPYDLAVPLLRMYPKEMKIYLQEYLYKNIYNCLILNSAKPEATQIPTYRRMNR